MQDFDSSSKAPDATEVNLDNKLIDSCCSQNASLSGEFQRLVAPFSGLPALHERLMNVLPKLPNEVQQDFLSDPHFKISLDDCEPGKGRTVLMPSLNPNGSESRCVVLKPRLATCSIEFAYYIIAHEFAHAFLRNGGWGEITDREEAADALAASWGFEKPKTMFWY